MSIRGHLKKLASESGIYGLAPIAQRLVGVFLTPLYTRLFTPADYGTMSLVDATLQFAGPLVVLHLDSAAFRWFYESDDEKDRQRTIASWFWTHLTVATLAFLVAAALPDHVFRRAGGDDMGLLLAMAMGTLPLATLEIVLINYLRMQRRAWEASGVMLAGVFGSLALTFLFVVHLRLGLRGIYLASLCTRGAIGIYALFVLRGWISPRRFDLTRLRGMLKYSLPMVPAAIFGWVISASDRFVLAHYWGAEEVGLYSIGIAIGAVVVLAAGAFQNAWGAFAFSIADRPEAGSTYAVVMELYLYGGCLMALGLALFAPEALRLLTVPRYYAAENVVALIAVGYVLLFLYHVTGLGSLLARNTHTLLEAFAVAAVLNAVLTFTLVPRFGRVGAATATLIAQAALPLYLLVRSQRLYPIPYRTWTIVVFPAAALTIAFAGRSLVAGLGFVAALCLKAVLLALYVGLIMLLPAARVRILGMLRSRSVLPTAL